MDWPPDILDRMRSSFGEGSAAALLARAEAAGRESPAIGPRVVRCIMFLSGGDHRKFEYNLDVATKDFRDVIYWAEYDRDARVRDFNRPFGEAEL